MLITQEALKRIVGERSYYQLKLFIPAIVQTLRELRDAIQQVPAWQAPVLVQTDVEGDSLDILVRRNPLACPPYTLVTLQ